MQAYCDSHVILFLLFNFRPSMHYSFNSDFESLLQKRTIISYLISAYEISEYNSSYASLSLLHSQYCSVDTAMLILPCQYCIAHTALLILPCPYCPVDTALSILPCLYCPVDTALSILICTLLPCFLQFVYYYCFKWSEAGKSFVTIIFAIIYTEGLMEP